MGLFWESLYSVRILILFFCVCDVTGNRIKINDIRGNVPGGSKDSAQCLSSLSLIQASPSVYLMGWGSDEVMSLCSILPSCNICHLCHLLLVVLYHFMRMDLKVPQELNFINHKLWMIMGLQHRRSYTQHSKCIYMHTRKTNSSSIPLHKMHAEVVV